MCPSGWVGGRILNKSVPTTAGLAALAACALWFTVLPEAPLPRSLTFLCLLVGPPQSSGLPVLGLGLALLS